MYTLSAQQQHLSNSKSKRKSQAELGRNTVCELLQKCWVLLVISPWQLYSVESGLTVKIFDLEWGLTATWTSWTLLWVSEAMNRLKKLDLSLGLQITNMTPSEANSLVARVFPQASLLHAPQKKFVIAKQAVEQAASLSFWTCMQIHRVTLTTNTSCRNLPTSQAFVQQSPWLEKARNATGRTECPK